MDKRLLTLLLIAAIFLLPLQASAQIEGEFTTWQDIYGFKEDVMEFGEEVDYQFSYNAPYDRAIGDAGYGISTTKLLEVYVIADGPLNSVGFVADVQIIFSDLGENYFFPDMTNQQSETIALGIDYDDAHYEQALVIVIARYYPTIDTGEDIGAKIIFVWQVWWMEVTGLSSFDAAILVIVIVSIIVVARMKD